MEKQPTYFDKWREPKENSNYKFNEPTKTNVSKIEMGDSVKSDNNFERFWVKVIKFKDNAIFGMVDNNLVIKKDYDYKDIVVFGKQHVFDILKVKDKKNLQYTIKN